MLYVLRRVFDADIEAFGAKLIKEPEFFVNKEVQVVKLRKFIGHLLDGLMIDLNLETENLSNDFDYRGKLREKEFIVKLSNELLSSFLKDIKRGKALPLQALWDTIDN